MLTREEASVDGEMEGRKERRVGGPVVRECGSEAGCLQRAGRKGRHRRNEQTNDGGKYTKESYMQRKEWMGDWLERMERKAGMLAGKEGWEDRRKGPLAREE